MVSVLFVFLLHPCISFSKSLVTHALLVFPCGFFFPSFPLFVILLFLFLSLFLSFLFFFLSFCCPFCVFVWVFVRSFHTDSVTCCLLIFHYKLDNIKTSLSVSQAVCITFVLSVSRTRRPTSCCLPKTLCTTANWWKSILPIFVTHHPSVIKTLALT